MSLNYDLKVNGGAAGDGQFVTDVLTLTAGDTHLHSASNLFVPGDVGKYVVLDDTNGFTSKIDTYVAANHVVLHDVAPSPGIAGVATALAWGTNDDAAFIAFNTAGAAASGLVTLNVPSGIYIQVASSANASRWTRFIPQLKVVGTGNPMFVGMINLGTFTIPHATGGSWTGKLANVNPGDTSLQLLNISDTVKFHPNVVRNTASDGTVYTTGTWCNLTGIDTEGFGDPTPQFREFVNITSVNDTTGVLTLASPVKYEYLSTWPGYVPNGEVDNGGPATLYMYDASWDANIEFDGMRFWSPSSAINCPARFITFKNCAWVKNNAFNTGGRGFTPATCDTWTLDNTTFTGTVEVDKNIHQLNIINGSSGHRWWIQTAPCENMLIDSAVIDQLEGTARFTTINNSTVTNLILGPVANGCADSFTAINSSFGAISTEFSEQILPNPPFTYTISQGRITRPTGGNPTTRWAIPVKRVFLGGAQEASAGFTIKAVSGDGTPFTAASNTYVDTDLSGGWPNMQLGGGTDMFLITHPAPVATFVNCIGCNDAIDFSNLKAQNKPLFSYSKRTYANVASGSVIAIVPAPGVSEGGRLWGTIVSVKVTVNVAFTTPGALSLNLFGRFITNANDPLTGLLTAWLPQVDLKTVGTRTITATTFNNIGLDNLGPAPGLIHFSGRQSTFINGTITGGDPGTVTIEVQTDQGFNQFFPTGPKSLKGNF